MHFKGTDNSQTAAVYMSPRKQNELMWPSLSKERVCCCLLSRLLLWPVLPCKTTPTRVRIKYHTDIAKLSIQLCLCVSNRQQLSKLFYMPLAARCTPATGETRLVPFRASAPFEFNEHGARPKILKSNAPAAVVAGVDQLIGVPNKSPLFRNSTRNQTLPYARDNPTTCPSFCSAR